jgi:hypothetical protein
LVTSNSVDAARQSVALCAFARNGGTVRFHTRGGFDKALIESVAGV